LSASSDGRRWTVMNRNCNECGAPLMAVGGGQVVCVRCDLDEDDAVVMNEADDVAK